MCPKITLLITRWTLASASYYVRKNTLLNAGCALWLEVSYVAGNKVNYVTGISKRVTLIENRSPNKKCSSPRSDKKMRDFLNVKPGGTSKYELGCAGPNKKGWTRSKCTFPDSHSYVWLALWRLPAAAGAKDVCSLLCPDTLPALPKASLVASPLTKSTLPLSQSERTHISRTQLHAHNWPVHCPSLSPNYKCYCNRL